MDLREWIIGQHSGISTILKMNLLSAVPEARLPERPGSGANSIAWLLWHIARTEDVAKRRAQGVDSFVGRWGQEDGSEHDPPQVQAASLDSVPGDGARCRPSARP